jgi:hypothetical protein
MKLAEICAESFHELRGILLEHLEDLHRCVFLGEMTKNMNVVLDSANGDGVTLQILQNPGLISPHAASNVVAQPWTPILRGEDDMRAENMQ